MLPNLPAASPREAGLGWMKSVHSDRTRSAADLERLAELLDSRWRIPGTSVRLGIDALVGLLPGVGDAATGLVSAWIVLHAMRHGAGRGVVARMIANVLIDTAVGSVPILGSIFDVFFRSNNRNIELLRSHLEKMDENARRRGGRS